jgi:hypothetical protein
VLPAEPCIAGQPGAVAKILRDGKYDVRYAGHESDVRRCVQCGHVPHLLTAGSEPLKAQK